MNERMSEETLKLREGTTYESEFIGEDGMYVRQENTKVELWGFYLNFCGQWFYPCRADQERLKNLVLGSNRFTIGNKDYTQPIELAMRFDYEDDDGWKEVERRKPTEQDLAKVKDKQMDCYNDKINEQLFPY